VTGTFEDFFHSISEGDMAMGAKILGLGALNLDFIFGYRRGDGWLQFSGWSEEEERILSEKEWWQYFYAYAQGRRFHISAGGSAANTIAAIAAMDPQMPVSVAGLLGQDPEAEVIESDTYWKRVETQMVIRDSSRGNTGRCLSYVGREKRRQLAVTPGINTTFAVTDVDLDSIRQFDWLHVSSFAEEQNNSQLAHLLEQLRRMVPSLRISVDPGTFLTRRGLTATARLILQNCDYLFLKTPELWALGEQPPGPTTPDSQSEEAARKIILASGQRLTIVVERLPKGFTVHRYEDRVVPDWVPFPEGIVNEEVIKDNTGSGDVFDAAFIYGMVSGFTMEQISRLAGGVIDANLRHMGRSGYDEFRSKLLEIQQEPQDIVEPQPVGRQETMVSDKKEYLVMIFNSKPKEATRADVDDLRMKLRGQCGLWIDQPKQDTLSWDREVTLSDAVQKMLALLIEHEDEVMSYSTLYFKVTGKHEYADDKSREGIKLIRGRVQRWRLELRQQAPKFVYLCFPKGKGGGYRLRPNSEAPYCFIFAKDFFAF
jgi:sugar/nucleoside kinase (ribokinase family)